MITAKFGILDRTTYESPRAAQTAEGMTPKELASMQDHSTVPQLESESRKCVLCGAALVRRAGERASSFKRRRSCGRSCPSHTITLKPCSQCGKMKTPRRRETTRQYAARHTCGNPECVSKQTSRKDMRICPVCDSGFKAVPSDPKKYCTVECKNIGLRKAVYDDRLGCLVRECTECGEIKPLDQFNKHDETRHRPYCRDCQSGYFKDWRESRPEEEKERQRKWHAGNREHVYQYNVAYRKRAIASVTRICPRCGDEFRPTSVESRYCSRLCGGRARVEARRRRGEIGAPFEFNCQECGKKVVDSPSRSDRKYCSRECAWPAKMRSMASRKSTSIELAVYAALDAVCVEYHAQHVIGTWAVDAFVPSLKLVIECQGDYWHCNPEVFPDGPINHTQAKVAERDIRRRAWFQRRGYRYAELWESDIKEIGAADLISGILKPE